MFQYRTRQKKAIIQLAAICGRILKTGEQIYCQITKGTQPRQILSGLSALPYVQTVLILKKDFFKTHQNF